MKRAAYTYRRASARGSVLIIVLWVTLGLAAMAFAFAHSTLMAYRGSDNEFAGRQATEAVDAGAQYALSILRAQTTVDIMPDVTTYQTELVPLGPSYFWFIGSPESDTTGVSFVGSTTPAFGLVDEASKININMVEKDADGVPFLYKLLANLPGMTEEIASAIIDWRDTDENVYQSGAESETYSGKSPAYSSKNKPFESVEEIALVNNATFEVLYGEDANLNGVLDPNENDGTQTAPLDNADGQLEPGILSYLTSFSYELNKRADTGEKKVNLTNLAATRTLMDDKLGEDVSLRITTSLAVKHPTGLPVRSVMEFYIDGELSEEEFSKIADLICVTEDDTIVGKININTAGQTVLACIPGIGTEKASAVVSARTSSPPQSSSIAWLRTALGDDDAAIQAGPYITGATTQISADVAAVGHDGRGYRRARFVIDRSSGTPKIVYRRDLSNLGWALGSDARQALNERKGSW